MGQRFGAAKPRGMLGISTSRWGWQLNGRSARQHRRRSMIRGSCLCGAVRYEIMSPLRKMTHCHCSMCRKAHGAAFATYAEVQFHDIRFVQGRELISHYRSSEKAQRSFCSQCGSNLLFEPTNTPDEVWVAIGGLDTNPKERPVAHIYVDSKAPWFEIRDSLPQFPGDS